MAGTIRCHRACTFAAATAGVVGSCGSVATASRRAWGTPAIIAGLGMTHASIRVERAASARLPALSGVLGRAFADEPMIQWRLGGGAPVETITQIFRLLYAGPAELGMLWEGGDGEGVAAWIAPGEAALLTASDHAAATSTNR